VLNGFLKGLVLALAKQNLEKNIINRVISRLQGIDGEGDYNFDVPDRNIKESFVPQPDAEGFPFLCLGEVTCGASETAIRGVFTIPITIEIWGYVEKFDTPIEDALKLASDIRVAIADDEQLNSQIIQMTFSYEVGAMEKFGIVAFKITGSFLHVI